MEKNGYGKRIGLLTVALPLLLAACHKEVTDWPGQQTGEPLRITATIGTASTRATDTEFEADDVIKVARTSDGKTGNYKKNGSAWEFVTGSGENFGTMTDGTAFTASYPSDFSAILADQTTQAGYAVSNHLTASASSAANHLNFQFSPAGAKININVAYKEAVAVSGLNVSGTGIRTESSDSETVNLLRTTGKEVLAYHTFTGILRAATYASGYTITLTKNDNTTSTYSQSVSITLSAGHAYTYNFTYGVELELQSVTVEDFENKEDDNGDDVGDAT